MYCTKLALPWSPLLATLVTVGANQSLEIRGVSSHTWRCSKCDKVFMRQTVLAFESNNLSYATQRRLVARCYRCYNRSRTCWHVYDEQLRYSSERLGYSSCCIGLLHRTRSFYYTDQHR